MALFDFNLEPVKTMITDVPKVSVKKRNVSYEELIHLNKVITDIPGYDDFTAEKYPYGLVFHDFEVFMYDWLVVLIDPINKIKTIIANNRTALKEYYELHKNCVWVGYNNKHYDTPILKGIISGYDPKEISDKLIIEGKKPFELYKDYNFKVKQLYVYDVMAKKVPPESLKLLEAFMGNDIEETEVDFNLDRPLTKKEIFQTMKYCIHDVEQTIEVFRNRINDFNAQIALIETFDLPFEDVNRTKGQLTAKIVNCEKKEHNDEFEITLVPTIRLEKYKYVMDWFIQACKNKDYSAKLETMVCGVPHQFGWGGVHGAPDKPIHIKGKIFHQDVNSFYPSLMIAYNLLTRNCKSPEKFKEVYDTRIALKKAGKKKEQAPLKIILNSQYGITKDKNSDAYDPVQANNICINGQLLLLDLIEHLEKRLGNHMQLINSNTDGIIIMIDEEERSEKIMNHVINEWSVRTHMGMGKDEITEFHGKDVNNYLFRFTNGKLEVKGKYVKENNPLDNNLPILNEALVKFISEGIPVEDTINNCNEMIKFQNVYRLSGAYGAAWHNGEYLTNKTYRIFASTDIKDTYLGKCKAVGAKVDKFQDTPDHCFIYNKSVKDIPMSVKLDKLWYIDMAKKRLEQYGYDMQKSNELF